MPEQSQSFNTWAIVEVMGHKRFAGYVTEQVFGSAALIRVDVPATEQPPRRGYLPNGDYGTLPARTTAEYSKLIGVSSIYCITPCTEEVARKVARVIEAENDPIPVHIPVERQLPAPRASDDDIDEEDVVPVGGSDDDDDALPFR